MSDETSLPIKPLTFARLPANSWLQGEERLFLVLNGQDEILRMYKSDTIQFDEPEEGAQGAEVEAAAIETPVLVCSLHWCAEES